MLGIVDTGEDVVDRGIDRKLARYARALLKSGTVQMLALGSFVVGRMSRGGCEEGGG